jgi:hypothetical protein
MSIRPTVSPAQSEQFEPRRDSAPIEIRSPLRMVIVGASRTPRPIAAARRGATWL